MMDVGVMGGGLQLYGLLASFSQIVWLVFGILACVWLWKQIQK